MATKDRIFLAHASEDKPQVKQLYQQLQDKGFSPWLDAVDLIPGQNWREEIPKAIGDAAVCLACLSKRSVAKEGYVQREFRYGLSAYAERPPGTIYLIPVRLDDCGVPDIRLPQLELNLRDLHWVDLFEVDGFEKLVGAIERNVKPTRPAKSALSEPKPSPKPPPKLKTVPPAPKVASVPQPKPTEIIRDIDAPWCPEMVVIPAGTFLMGSSETETGRDLHETQHKVTISKPFVLGRSPVSFDQYDYFCDQTGREKPDSWGWGRGDQPVIYVSHMDASAYCAWLSEATGRRCHLPSEAQWEYACRACTTTAYAFGDKILNEQANFGRNVRRTSTLGRYTANAWGLHDMHGNVWEWCADRFDDYSSAAVTDPQGPSTGTLRVVRGGSWDDDAPRVRSAYRHGYGPGGRSNDLGFRCAGVHEKS